MQTSFYKYNFILLLIIYFIFNFNNLLQVYSKKTILVKFRKKTKAIFEKKVMTKFRKFDLVNQM